MNEKSTELAEKEEVSKPENTNQIEEIEVIKPKKIAEDPRYSQLMNYKHVFLPLLNGDSLRLERLARLFTQQIRSQGEVFSSLSEQSARRAFIELCACNLEPIDGKVYLLPAKKDKKGLADPTAMEVDIGYKGHLELLWRSNLIANAYSNIVYEEDEFEITYGMRTQFVHKPKFGLERSKDKIKLTYGVAVLKTGDVQVKTASKAEIENARSLSPSGRSEYGPWAKHYEAMAQKTALNKLTNSLSGIRKKDYAFQQVEFTEVDEEVGNN